MRCRSPCLLIHADPPRDPGLDAFCEAVSTIPSQLIDGWTDLAPDGLSSAALSPSLPSIPRVARIRLQFLGGLRALLLIAQAGDAPRAAEHLALLFASGVVPPAAWAVLLLDSVRYLQGGWREHCRGKAFGLIERCHADPDVLLTAKETFEILRHVEEIVSAAEYAPEAYFSLLRRLSQRGEVATPHPATGKRGDGADGWAAERAALDVVRIAALDNLARTGMDLVQGWA